MEGYCRTFLGVPLKVSGIFRDSVSSLKSELRNERISWPVNSNYHITLEFLGETAVERIPLIKERLDQLPSIESRRLKLTGFGSFGKKRTPRVIYASVEDEGFLNYVRKEVLSVLSDYLGDSTRSKFVPHLTVGRIKNLHDPERFYEVMDHINREFRQEEAEVDKMVFLKSELLREGARYTVLKEIPFRVP